MPKKLAHLLLELAKAGFRNRGGKGSHRVYNHPCGLRVVVSFHAGEAKPYQQREIEKAIQVAASRKHKDGKS